MAYLNFSDALMEAKRRAQIQGRTVSQPEAAGLSEGVASGAAQRSVAAEDLRLRREAVDTQKQQFEKQLASTKEQFDKQIGLEQQKFGEAQSQFAQTLSNTKSQYEDTLSLEKSKYETSQLNWEKQFGLQGKQYEDQLNLQKSTFEEQKRQFTANYDLKINELTQAKTLAEQDLAEKIRQYDASSAAQKEQFGAQMELQIANSQKQAEQFKLQLDNQKSEFATTLASNQTQFEKNYELQKVQFEAELAQAKAAQSDGGGGTWICTATKKTVGMSMEELSSMARLREYAKTNHAYCHDLYMEEGPRLIAAIAEQQQDAMAFYATVRTILVEPVVRLVKSKSMETAYQLYRSVTIFLSSIYTPEIEIKEANHAV